MTGNRLQIRTERHGVLPRSQPPSCLSPAGGPSLPRDAERPEAALPGMPGNPSPSCPSPIAIPSLNHGT
jgi:hypothetical protein